MEFLLTFAQNDRIDRQCRQPGMISDDLSFFPGQGLFGGGRRLFPHFAFANPGFGFGLSLSLYFFRPVLHVRPLFS